MHTNTSDENIRIKSFTSSARHIQKKAQGALVTPEHVNCSFFTKFPKYVEYHTQTIKAAFFEVQCTFGSFSSTESPSFHAQGYAKNCKCVQL